MLWRGFGAFVFALGLLLAGFGSLWVRFAFAWARAAFVLGWLCPGFVLAWIRFGFALRWLQLRLPKTGVANTSQALDDKSETLDPRP